MSQLQVGDTAPDFKTTTDSGETVQLSDFRGKRVVLYFYPKDDTAGCTTQACSFRDGYADIEAQDAAVLGVSPDSQDSHQNFKTKFNLPFPLLVDEDHAIAERYGVWGEKTRDGRTYMGINRSHFVINEDGKLIGVAYDVKPDASMPAALETLTG